jgi:D-xylose transport system substrate-binding protein
MKTYRPLIGALAVLVALTACGGSAGAPSGKKIALLLPESTTTRYETKDRPAFTAKLSSICPNCQLLYSNAQNSAATQQSQAESALAAGASVLVMDPVDANAATGIAQMAAQKEVPIVAYDRLVLGSADVDYYVSFDNVKVGQLQATELLGALGGKSNPTVVMLNGDPADPNAALFKQGAMSVLSGKANIVKQYDTPGYSPDKAQAEMQEALGALNNKVDGVLAANDGIAGGAIAAMTAAGLSPLPPTTGQDAQLDAVQRILTGQQSMTVYKAIQPEAEATAQLAVALASPEGGVALGNILGAAAGMVNGSVNNKAKDVPSVLLTPVVVNKTNVGSTVVASGFWSRDQICTAPIASACQAAGV